MKIHMNDMAALFLYCRRKKKLSQRAMASLLLVNQSTVCRIECGVINPRKRTNAKLEKLMGASIKEMLPMALQAKMVWKSSKEVVQNNPVTSNELNYDHLSASDLDYLKSKWYVLVKEADTALSRKSYKLKKTSKKFLMDQLVSQYLDEQLAFQQRLMNYLANTGSSDRMLAQQWQHISVLGTVKQHYSAQSTALSSVELFLQKVALEEMEVIKQFRMEKMEELTMRRE